MTNKNMYYHCFEAQVSNPSLLAIYTDVILPPLEAPPKIWTSSPPECPPF